MRQVLLVSLSLLACSTPGPSKGEPQPSGERPPNIVFFLADDGVHGEELWVTDGTEAGTHLVLDIMPVTPSRFGSMFHFVAL